MAKWEGEQRVPEAEKEEGGGYEGDGLPGYSHPASPGHSPQPCSGSLDLGEWPRTVTEGASRGTCWPPRGTPDKSPALR